MDFYFPKRATMTASGHAGAHWIFAQWDPEGYIVGSTAVAYIIMAVENELGK